MKLFPGPGSQKLQFPALTGIRALAAGMVFFHHLPLHLKPDILMGLQASFYSGVTLFFVLSGFLITYRYYDENLLSGRRFGTYLVNRFARIYPVYFLVLTIVLLLLKNEDPIFLLQNYTLTHNLEFVFRTHGMAIDPSWSLTVEECFYLLAPFIFWLAKKYRLWVPFGLTLLVLGLLLARAGSNEPDRRSIFLLCSETFFGNAVKFFAGSWLALILLKKGIPERKGQRWTIAGIGGILLVLTLLTYVTNKGEVLKRLVMIIGNNILLPLPVIMFYYGLISEKSFVRRLLSNPVTQLLGRSSYSFYLIHQPVIDFLAKPYILPHFKHYDAYVLTVLAICIIASIALFMLYERPMNYLIRRRKIA